MSGVADLDRLDALLDEIQGIGTSTSPRSNASNGDYNQSAGEEPVEDEPQEEPEEPEEPAELPSASKTGTVKKRSNSKGAQTKPSSSTASGSKSSKTGTTRSSSSTKKSSSGLSSSSRSSTVKKPVPVKTKSSSSLNKPVTHSVGDTHIIEVNGQKYDMSTVKIKRAAAPSTLKRTNTNSKPKVRSRWIIISLRKLA